MKPQTRMTLLVLISLSVAPSATAWQIKGLVTGNFTPRHELYSTLPLSDPEIIWNWLHLITVKTSTYLEAQAIANTVDKDSLRGALNDYRNADNFPLLTLAFVLSPDPHAKNARFILRAIQEPDNLGFDSAEEQIRSKVNAIHLLGLAKGADIRRELRKLMEADEALQLVTNYLPFIRGGGTYPQSFKKWLVAKVQEQAAIGLVINGDSNPCKNCDRAKFVSAYIAKFGLIRFIDGEMGSGSDYEDQALVLSNNLNLGHLFPLFAGGEKAPPLLCINSH